MLPVIRCLAADNYILEGINQRRRNANIHPHCSERAKSRLEHLVPLLTPLQPLDSLLVHLLCHLLVAFLLLLGLPPVLDLLDVLLRGIRTTAFFESDT